MAENWRKLAKEDFGGLLTWTKVIPSVSNLLSENAKKLSLEVWVIVIVNM